MGIKKTTFNFDGTKTIITYDLSDNDVSASTIASKSNHLYTTTSISGVSYNLPNTTLGSGLKSTTDAIAEFCAAFAKTNSKAKITRLFAIEVFGKSGYIENNE